MVKVLPVVLVVQPVEFCVLCLELGLDDGVEGTDYVQVELWADPHCVGIYQLSADVGALATISALVSRKWLILFRSSEMRNGWGACKSLILLRCAKLRIGQFSEYFCSQLLHVVRAQKIGWLMTFFASGSLVQIVQTVPTSLVLADRVAADREGCGFHR